MEAKKLTAALALSIAVLAPLAIVPAAAAPREMTVMEYLAAEVAAEQAAGRTTGTQVIWTANGPVEREITAEEFLAIAGEVIGLAGDENFVGEDQAGGVGTGSVGCGSLSPADPWAASCNSPVWPFCDVASVFMIHSGAPGGSIIQDNAIPALSPAVPVCGGFYGVTQSRTATLSSGAVTGVTLFCGAVEVWLTPGTSSAAIGPGGYRCAAGIGAPMVFTTATTVGNSAKLAINFGINLDYFLGAGNFVVLA